MFVLHVLQWQLTYKNDRATVIIYSILKTIAIATKYKLLESFIK